MIDLDCVLFIIGLVIEERFIECIDFIWIKESVYNLVYKINVFEVFVIKGILKFLFRKFFLLVFWFESWLFSDFLYTYTFLFILLLGLDLFD